MKKLATIAAQVFLLLFGLGVLAFLIRFPLTEGRAENLDLVGIYLDPFILYAYLSSGAFFAGVYQAFRFMGFIRRGEEASPRALRTLKRVRFCAVLSAFLVALASVYILLFHDPADDPVGFLVIGTVVVSIAAAFSVATVLLESRLRDTREARGIRPV